jgi:tyrosinase
MLAKLILLLVAANILFVTTAAALPPQLNTRQSTCTSVEVRKEWRNFTSAEQTAYLEAEVCLMNLPGETGLAAVTSRYSDLAALHQNQTLIIHKVGQFLPWHRYFVHVHQSILQSQCNYNGPIP